MPNCSLPSKSCGHQEEKPATENAKIRVEFAVNINNPDDLKKIDEALKPKGFSLVSSDFEERTIQLELLTGGDSAINNANSLQKFIEEHTGFLAVFKGIGELSSAVAELRPSSNSLNDNFHHQVMGIVRLSHLEGGFCYFDGSIDGFRIPRGKTTSTHGRQEVTGGSHYSLAIHRYGDLADKNLESIGESILEIDRQPSNSLDCFKTISKLIPNCDVPGMIGRSIALTENSNHDNSSSEKVLSAGVIARASTIGANTKKICSCSGKTIWEERIDKKRTE